MSLVLLLRVVLGRKKRGTRVSTLMSGGCTTRNNIKTLESEVFVKKSLILSIFSHSDESAWEGGTDTNPSKTVV